MNTFTNYCYASFNVLLRKLCFCIHRFVFVLILLMTYGSSQLYAQCNAEAGIPLCEDASICYGWEITIPPFQGYTENGHSQAYLLVDQDLNVLAYTDDPSTNFLSGDYNNVAGDYYVCGVNYLTDWGLEVAIGMSITSALSHSNMPDGETPCIDYTATGEECTTTVLEDLSIEVQPSSCSDGYMSYTVYVNGGSGSYVFNSELSFTQVNPGEYISETVIGDGSGSYTIDVQDAANEFCMVFGGTYVPFCCEANSGDLTCEDSAICMGEDISIPVYSNYSTGDYEQIYALVTNDDFIVQAYNDGSVPFTADDYGYATGGYMVCAINYYISWGIDIQTGIDIQSAISQPFAPGEASCYHITTFNECLTTVQNCSASIGDKVFNDLNGNGVQDEDEPGMEGVTVQLKDADGNVIETATTDSNGDYSFGNLAPGTYYVETVNVPDYTYTTDVTFTISIIDGTENITDADFGMQLNLPSLDANDDNVTTEEDMSVTISILDNDTPAGGDFTIEIISSTPGATIIINDDGTINYTPPPGFSGTDEFVYQISGPDYANIDQATVTIEVTPTPTGSIGDLVWNDMNGNGIQDSGEPGLHNITVILSDADGNVIATTVTDMEGNYIFPEVGYGTYYVTLEDLTGYTYTTNSQYYITIDQTQTNVTDADFGLQYVPTETLEAIDDNATTQEGSSVAIDITDNDIPSGR